MMHFYSKKIFTFLFLLLIASSAFSQSALLKSRYSLYSEQIKQAAAFPFSVVDGKLLKSKLPVLTSQIRVAKPTYMQVTEILDQDWNSGTWVNINRYLYEYNSAGRQQTYTSQNWSAGAWENQYKSETGYNSEGNISSSTGYNWENGAWVPMMRYTYSYNSEGRNDLYIGEEWKNGAWQNYVRYTYTYDASGYTTSAFGEMYENGVWENYYKGTYVYDSNHHQIQYTTQYWNSGVWENSYKSTYEYDSNGNETAYISYMWMGTDWIYTSKYTYTYDDKNRELEDTYYTWLNYIGPWTAVSKTIYTYNADGRYDILTDQTWTDPGPWVNDIQSAYTYEGGLTKKILYSAWNGSSWENDSQTLYTYTDVVDVNEHNTIPENFSLSQNYPNPFNPSTVISYELPRESFVTLKVYDMLGREVSTLVNELKNAGTYQVQFKADRLSGGVYFYKITAGEFSKTAKMLFIK